MESWQCNLKSPAGIRHTAAFHAQVLKPPLWVQGLWTMAAAKHGERKLPILSERGFEYFVLWQGKRTEHGPHGEAGE